RLPGCRPRACPCLGQCDAGPALSLDGRIHTGASEDSLIVLLAAHKTGRPRRASRPAGLRESKNLFPYRRGGAFHVLKSLRRKGDPDAVIAALKESGLRGMGGAGFPAGAKWEIVRRAPGGEKVVICNADESEPGAFKDRALLDTHPALVLEGMLIAAWAVGARRAIVYIRSEYARQRRSLGRALRAAREGGLLGGRKGPEAEIFVSPGGYICGEETALLEVLEDKRAQPRDKPPYPGVEGLFGRPTLINNAETFALVPAILRKGPGWYAGFGRGGGRGFKLLSISGPVRRPGVYEVELGTPIRALIEEKAGGL
ncbi:MAG: SLBB domain-containing protein, partial [bacterium]